jgi:NAD+ diphosphatase
MKHLFFAGQDIFVGQGPALDFPPEADDVTATTVAIGHRDFDLDGTRYAAWMLDDQRAEAALGPSLRRITLRDALAEFPAEAMRPALRGIALLRWLETARFCGACGAPLADKDRGSEDSGGRFCTACGRVHFPRISPAVIVLIRKGPHALLAHNARFRNGFFGLIAGFVEAGETLEEAAVREAREEAGIEIRDLRYAKSQPWPFPDSLMVAFKAEWASGEAKPDGFEIAELRWCLPSELPNIPPKGSVARYLLDEFASET